MSYRLRPLLLCLALAAPARADAPAAAPVVPAPGDWLADADAAARPVTYAVVPLPPATAGSFACVLLVVALRFSRHRHWVTLR